MNEQGSAPPEIVYTSESRFEHPGQLLKEMFGDLRRAGPFAARMFVRNFRAQYRQLFLGALWAFIPPIAAALGFIFAKRAGILRFGPTELPYPTYVIFGLLLWQTLVEALHAPIAAVSGERTILRSQNVPIEGLIFARLAEVMLNFMVKFVLIFLILLWFKTPLYWTALWMPGSVAVMIIFGLSIGLIFAPFNIIYRDVSRGLVLLSTLWLFLTPAVYPQPRKGAFAALVRWNPATSLIVTSRELVTSDKLTQLPEFLIVTLLSVVALLVTWMIFRVSLPYAVERLN